MSDFTIQPDQPIERNETIAAITIAEIRIYPGKDKIKITALAGNRATVVEIDNANADPEATPPVVGDYDAVIALADTAAMAALLKAKIAAAIS